MYRGREGMWSWVLHRATGVGVLLFLLAHILDTMLVGWGPGVYNAVVAIYHIPFFRVMEVALVGAVVYHAVNGLRVIVIDFWPSTTVYHRQLFWAAVVLFLLIYLPTAFVMLRPLMA